MLTKHRFKPDNAHGLSNLFLNYAIRHSLYPVYETSDKNKLSSRINRIYRAIYLANINHHVN